MKREPPIGNDRRFVFPLPASLYRTRQAAHWRNAPDIGKAKAVDGMWQFPLTATLAPNQKRNIAMTRTGFFDRYGYYPDFVFYGGAAGFDQMRPYLNWTNIITFSLANSGDEVLLLGPADQLIDGVAWGTGTLPGNTSCVAFAPPPYPSLTRSPIWADTDNCPIDFIADPSALP